MNFATDFFAGPSTLAPQAEWSVTMFYLTGVLFLLGVISAWSHANIGRGYLVADRLCVSGKVLCDNPKWLLIASAAMAIIALYRMSVKQ